MTDLRNAANFPDDEKNLLQDLEREMEREISSSNSFPLYQPHNCQMGEFFRDRNQPQELNLNSQLKELTLYEANIEIRCLGKEAMSRLEGDPYLPGLIFVEREQFVGMISRQSFFEWMSRPYSLELFSKRPLQRFYDYSQTEYLVCSGEKAIAKTVTLALPKNGV